jgi:hypothetical protein
MSIGVLWTPMCHYWSGSSASGNGEALWGLIGGFVVRTSHEAGGIRLDSEEEFNGADASIHRIFATPEGEA